MAGVRVEISKKFSGCYLVKPEDVIRIKRIMDEAIKKKSNSEITKFTTSVKYTNDTVVTGETVEKILEQENYGSSLVDGIYISADGGEKESKENEKSYIHLVIANEEESFLDRPIKYGSQLNEKIQKMKSPFMIKVFNLAAESMFEYVILFAISMLSMLVYISYYVQSQNDYLDQFREGGFELGIDRPYPSARERRTGRVGWGYGARGAGARSTSRTGSCAASNATAARAAG